MNHYKASLLAGVSVLAITVANPAAVVAADLPARPAMITKAPVLAPVSPWTFWVEGGLQHVGGGDPSIAGLTPDFAPAKKAWGWSGAAALDYRINPFWHVSAGFRYGAHKSRTTNSIQNGLGLYSGSATSPTTTPATGLNSATRKESNWVADFMVGRELGLGAGSSQFKVGLRVAHIKGTTDGAGQLVTAGTTPTVVNYSYSQTSKFTGWGPRAALEGNMPLTGPWSIDYMVGAAALFGNRTIDQTATVNGIPSPGFTFLGCVSGCPGTFSNSSNGTVFNTDAMLGIAYAITPSAKLGLNYRVDYYANAMRTVDSAGNFSNTNRTYHGPNLRLTVNF